MTAITPEVLAAERKALELSAMNLRGRRQAAERQVELLNVEMNANSGAIQFIDHLLRVLNEPEVVSPAGEKPTEAGQRLTVGV